MFGTYNRLRVTIYDSNIAVIRAARKKIAKKHRRECARRSARHEFYRLMLSYHRAAIDLASEWRL